MTSSGYSRSTKIKLRSRTEQIVISYTALPLIGARLEQAIPIKGTITSITPHFPLGCNALVDVAIGHGAKQMCPSVGVLALDNATPVIPVSERVEEAELFWVEVANGDAVNPHTITIVATVER